MNTATLARRQDSALPRTVPGLQLWLDARRPGATFADGDPVATWKDLSGLGHDVAQATAGKRPLWRGTSRNLLTFNQATVEADTTGLSVVANCAIARSTTKAAQGVASLALTASAANAQAGIAASSVAVTAAVTYTFQVSGLTASAARTAGAVIDWYDAGSGLLSTSSSSTSVLSTSAWTVYTITDAAPTGAVNARLSFLVADSANAEVFYADQFGFWVGSSSVWVPPVVLPNGQPVMQFDGLDDGLSGACALPGASTIYIAAAQYKPGSVQSLVLFRDSAASAALTVDVNANELRSYIKDDAAVSALKQSANVVTNMVLFVGSSVRTHAASDSIDIALNNIIESVATATVGTLTQTQVSIGFRHYDGTYPLTGVVACILAYSGAHDASTRKKIGRWLGRQYGVTVTQ